MYAFHSEAHQADLDRTKSFFPENMEASELIREELSGQMSFYYEKVRGDDELFWGRFL